ncbi:DNA polymerase beta domain protein region [Acetohalobium arabaticum DSM 5501]|uniref:DNA polymerase beta domain protein region n=2 Tax=Acetohalobium TaxID=28186 RepID=D9QQV2_ACEAZ|nr:DNA polymerase beta domain protein region [Acetohalobium arabaticum DSM 5501]
MDKESIITTVREYCEEYKEIIGVYLFGSVAKDKFNNQSDIDIALMLDDKLDKLSVFDFKLQIAVGLEELLDREVDVVIFSNADLRLKHQILKGQLIIGKDNKLRVRKESEALSNYLDMKYFYNMYESELGRKFTDGK